jgi:hypothetical protein
MKKLGIFILFLFLPLFVGLNYSEADYDDYYRTYEVIKITKDSLTISDNDGNVIEINKDPQGYKVGYKVRYDKIRNRLRPYRWQEYQVIAVSETKITLRHKTGDTLTVMGNYQGEYNIGDQVRYDSIANKLAKKSQ